MNECSVPAHQEAERCIHVGYRCVVEWSPCPGWHHRPEYFYEIEPGQRALLEWGDWDYLLGKMLLGEDPSGTDFVDTAELAVGLRP